MLRHPQHLQAEFWRAAQKEKDAKEGKGKQGANVDTEMSLPHHASDMDELDIVIKLHRVERHIRKNKLKVLCRGLFSSIYTMASTRGSAGTLGCSAAIHRLARTLDLVS